MFLAEMRESLRRMFQQVLLLAGFAGCHCWRQIDKPLGIGCKATHAFKCGYGILLSDGQISMESRFNDPFSADIINVENVILLVLLRQGRRGLCSYERLRRFVISLMRWN